MSANTSNARRDAVLAAAQRASDAQRTIDAASTRYDLQTIIGKLGSAQNALHFLTQSKRALTRAEMRTHAEYASADIALAREDIRTLARRLGVEY